MAESSNRGEGWSNEEQARRQAQTRQASTSDEGEGMSHPVATGVGALGGAAAGAAAGMVGGPVGSVAGAVAGAVLGGLGGNAVGEAIDPAAEDQYWSDNYQSEPYYQSGRSYDDYSPAYQLGVQGRTQYGGRFEDTENQLGQDWERQRGRSALSWNEAREPSRAAWQRVDQQLLTRGTGASTSSGSSYTASPSSTGGSYMGGSGSDTLSAARSMDSDETDTGNIRSRSSLGDSQVSGGTDSMDNEDVVDVLNDLVECCRDGEYGFRLCAEHVESGNIKERLAAHADECQRAAQELMDRIRQRGGEPDDGGTTSGAMHRGWVSLKGSLTGYSDRAMLEECERGEDTALGRYRRALKEDLPSDIRSLVQRQCEGVQRNHDEVKRLRDSLQDRT